MDTDQPGRVISNNLLIKYKIVNNENCEFYVFYAKLTIIVMKIVIFLIFFRGGDARRAEAF